MRSCTKIRRQDRLIADFFKKFILIKKNLLLILSFLSFLAIIHTKLKLEVSLCTMEFKSNWQINIAFLNASIPAEQLEHLLRLRKTLNKVHPDMLLCKHKDSCKNWVGVYSSNLFGSGEDDIGVYLERIQFDEMFLRWTEENPTQSRIVWIEILDLMRSRRIEEAKFFIHSIKNAIHGEVDIQLHVQKIRTRLDNWYDNIGNGKE